MSQALSNPARFKYRMRRRLVGKPRRHISFLPTGNVKCSEVMNFTHHPKMVNARYGIEADFSRSIIGDFFLAIS